MIKKGFFVFLGLRVTCESVLTWKKCHVSENSEEKVSLGVSAGATS